MPLIQQIARREESGFTLIELMVGMLITIIVFTLSFNFVQSLFSINNAAQARVVETDQAEQIVDTLKGSLTQATCSITYPAVNDACSIGTNVLLNTTANGNPYGLVPPGTPNGYTSGPNNMYYFTRVPGVVVNATTTTNPTTKADYLDTLNSVYLENSCTAAACPAGVQQYYLQLESGGSVQTIGQDIIYFGLTYYNSTANSYCEANGMGTTVPTSPAPASNSNSINTIGITVKVQQYRSSPVIAYSTCFFLTDSLSG